MATLGDVSILNINGNELNIKDASARSDVEEIITAIQQNNQDIGDRINNLNERLETVEDSEYLAHSHSDYLTSLSHNHAEYITSLEHSHDLAHAHSEYLTDLAHNHTEFATTSHTHNLAHAHSEYLTDLAHNHTEYITSLEHTHDLAHAHAEYLTDLAHNHTEFASTSHSHDLGHSHSTYVTQSDIDTSIASLVDSAPETLDTLNELAAALNDDPDFATTIATQIGQKASNTHSHNLAHAHSEYLTDLSHNHTEFATTSHTHNLAHAHSEYLTDLAHNHTEFASTSHTHNLAHAHSEFITSIKTVNNESLVGTGNIVISGLPQVSAADNGKILMVVNGQWQLVSPSVLYSGSGIPNNANGNNGDLYMQTD